MGFRTGSYAKVWSVEQKSDKSTKIRISIARKNRDGEFEQDFSGFVMVLGSGAAAEAAKLKEGDSIKLGDVDVSTRYDKESKKEFISYKMFSFEMADASSKKGAISSAAKAEVDGGEEPDLPF